MFEAEAEDIAAILGPELLAIHHIGSTAIPGTKAKPIIDILVEVRDVERLDGFNEALNALGYESLGEHGIPGRRFFRKPGEFTRTHHVHAYGRGHPEIERHLNFRDYLIAHPEEAQAYSRLKESLAREYSEDGEAYTEGKTAFIREIDAKAMAWRRSDLSTAHLAGRPPSAQGGTLVRRKDF